MIEWEHKVPHKLQLAVIGDSFPIFQLCPAYRMAEEDDLVNAINAMEHCAAVNLLRKTNAWAKEEGRLRDLIAMAVQRAEDAETGGPKK